ncbi:DNA helicase RecQ [uncultured Paraglaciecola sp.]|uniref:DNA helicase RecQ n=1 Tax=uncultured Paraglaciecola sp. TaxID=1765024 RepID=UPI0026271305|nr:DNA helicase RecQ [uncultured Paraglaciecola sp.]
MINQANTILKNVFGFEQFRESQEAIIGNVLHRHNTLAIMPTGGGKSLCYQIPASVFDGLTVVISPLISLMQDQVRQLNELAIPACVLNSSLSDSDYQNNLDAIKQQQIKLLFLAPETALQTNILDLLSHCDVACIAIDEAHCISEWGHDFRPEYRQLNRLIECFPNAVSIALTATATPRVREDIKRQLNIADNSEFISSFDRPNLFISVVPKDSPYQQCKTFVQQHPEQSGIIYCQSRKGVDELTAKLQQDGLSVLPYHAGLSSVKRGEYQERFIRDDVHIIVATIAFGMGINKPDVRYVLHYDLPKNIEGYYQQIGRAGRDGLDANCLLLFGYGDTGKIRFFIEQMSNEQEKRLANMHLNQMLALAEAEDCRRTPLLEYFGEASTKENCGNCDNCTTEGQEKSDLTVPAQKFLSCVHRTGQRFGASHIIDVLRGSSAEKVLQNQHNLLSTYNIGLELNKKQWMTLARQLIQKGLLNQDEQFGGLKLTQQAGEVLKGKVPFFALLQQAATTTSHTSKTLANPGDQQLVAILKADRKRLADAANLPPYAIFSDRTLNEMAYYFPHSEENLLRIHGIGQAKLDKYGEHFLRLIKDYCQQNNLQEVDNTQTASKATVNKSSSSSANSRSAEIVSAYETGQSIASLATQFKVKDGTIINHLYRYAQDGHKFTQPSQLLEQTGLDQPQIDSALAAFAEHSFERLKPVFDTLNEQVTYDQLHLLRIYFVSQLHK